MSLIIGGTIRGAIAEARIEISKCRQLCYLAACMCDEKGFKAARQYIGMIKVAAPRMALAIVDEAMQVHGGHGVSQYSKLSGMYRQLRTIRLAGKYSKRRRSNVAVIIIRIVFISPFFFCCLLLNHSFQTNPNKITNCFELFSLLQLCNYIAPASLFYF